MFVSKNFKWPTRDEYDIAMANLEQKAIDPELHWGVVERDRFNNIRHYGTGLYTSTYKISTTVPPQNQRRELMIRCFGTGTEGDPPDTIMERYEEIDRFCKANLNKVSALLRIEYVKRGLTVDYRNNNHTPPDNVLPIVKMPFIDAIPLGEYIEIYHEEPGRMQDLYTKWFQMMRQLEAAKMAHGDLDLTNVLVMNWQHWQSNPILKLVDYDNLWVPSFGPKNYPQSENGHKDFQHPYHIQNSCRPFNVEMDRFSALSTYLSLRLLALHPTLYDDWHADATSRLLFSRNDYRLEMENKKNDANHINHFRLLQSMQLPAEIWLYLGELLHALHDHRYIPIALDAYPTPPPVIVDTDGTIPAVWPAQTSGVTSRNEPVGWPAAQPVSSSPAPGQSQRSQSQYYQEEALPSSPSNTAQQKSNRRKLNKVQIVFIAVAVILFIVAILIAIKA
jgi:hypothetical protein